MKQFFNIVVPMAGRGSRFKKAGYVDSKPFIDVNGEPMISLVLHNLNIEFDSKFSLTILCQKDDFEKYNFSIFNSILGHSNINIIPIDDVTEGAACTVLLAEKFIDNNTPVLIVNSDQIIEYSPEPSFNLLKKKDGGMLVFEGYGNEWSYAKIDSIGFVTEVAEKNPISSYATAGYYFWTKGAHFVEDAKKMILNNDRTNNEFYLAPVYNWSIKAGRKITLAPIEKMIGLGTPENLKKYLSSV
jgi:dTDP-glucose pyrophosphorylase